MKKSKDLLTNIGDILTGNYDPDFVMTLIELMDPVTLSKAARTHISNKEGCQALEVAKNPSCRALLEEKMRQRGELAQSSHCLMM